ncbi:ribosomal L1 domain-containing protein CG13096 [Bactrocera oleae]|uniref:ribosomal L1 domain-containing protein CG13096 n=1 Tax=Bactrocera oleae TaxID=104688 RepID=UPI00387E3076
MVKLQKSLRKPLDIIEKKKTKLPAPPLAGISKSNKKEKAVTVLEKLPKSKKEKVAKTIIKDVEVVAPLKKEKAKKVNKVSKKFPSEPIKKKSEKVSEKKLEQASKRPLVLAPAESPKVPKLVTAKLKNKSKDKKSKVQKKKDKKVNPDNVEQATPLTNLQKKKAAKRAYKKEQIKKRRENKSVKTKKAPIKRLFKAPPFDEDKFNAIVSADNVKKIAKGLKKQVEKEVSEKKTAIFSDFQYFLNVSCFKIPNVPKRIVKLNLKHSLVDKDDDVAIIVSDLQRGSKVDYEPTIQHYEDIFREAGIEGLTIIPFNKLRNECNTFETVRKFGNTYDYFLCDGRLVGHASGFCGKVFQKPRTTFHSVRMDNQKNLKREIEKSLRRTAYKQLEKGDLISIPIGNHKFTDDQLVENIMHVMEQLKNSYPGGLANIRGIYLKISIAGTSSLPLFLSVAEPPPETPYVVGPREQRTLKLKRETNEVLSNFNLTKEGNLLKLSKTDVERKRKLKEMRAVIDAEPNTTEENKHDKANGKQAVVPAKKAKTEKSVITSDKSDKSKSKDEEPKVEEQGDEDEDDSEAEQEDEEENDSGEDEDVEEDDSGDEEDGDDDDDDDDDDGEDDEDDAEDEGKDEDEDGAGDDDKDEDDSEEDDDE